VGGRFRTCLAFESKSNLRALPPSPSYGWTGQTLGEVGRDRITQRAGICLNYALKPELISAQTLTVNGPFAGRAEEGRSDRSD